MTEPTTEPAKVPRAHAWGWQTINGRRALVCMACGAAKVPGMAVCPVLTDQAR